MHRRRHLGRRVPPMMCRRAAVAMMVITVVVGGACTEEPPIIVGDVPHARCRGRTDILQAWVVVEAMPPKTRVHWKNQSQVATINVEQDDERGRR
jgi:hypothetical protein